MTHQIPLYDNTAPINIRPYRLAEAHKVEINKQIKEMLDEEIIVPSKSPWNAPLLVVSKKGGEDKKPQWRIVVDFRRINEVTIGDAFPIPNITEILDHLGRSTYFTTLDLASGYHQIAVNEKDRAKTAFSTSFGHFEFNRMLFGLKGAPATFQRLMNYVFSGMQGHKCFVYLDDIVVYGDNLKEHMERLEEVFQRLKNYNLKLKPSKCNFLCKEITYLGHIISDKGINPDPTKTEVVRSCPRPHNVKTIQQFLGLANYYRRFIKDFSKISQPINNLLKKNTKFNWTNECEEAFMTLKNCLIQPPILQYPDFEKEFILTTDASEFALGAVLSQGEIGTDRPICFGSRTLNKAERNYAPIERELLAIVWATHTYKPYLWGRRFTVVTDHKPLLWMLSLKDPTSRLIRWQVRLSEFNFSVVYKPGKYNSNADALSRIPEHVVAVLTRAQAKSNPKFLIEPNTETSANVEIVEDVETQKRILGEMHDSPIGGHQGVQRTLKRVQQYYTWPGMANDVKEYINKCEICQKNKIGRGTKMPMNITSTSQKPFERVFLDIVGPMVSTHKNNKYILTFQDDLTKYSEAIPIPNAEANTVAEAFVTRVICTHGTPNSLLTDQGTNFLSQVFKNTCRLLKIKKIQTSAYHPQSNGALERSHRTLSEYLRNFTGKDPLAWDDWLPYAMFAYNSTPHTSTNFMPFELLYGFKPELPSSIKKHPEVCYNYDDYHNELRMRLQTSYTLARENLLKKKEKSKEYYDKNLVPLEVEIGKKVWLKNEKRVGKLSPLWLGPYEVTKIISPVNTEIKIKNGKKIVHNNRLKLVH